MGIFGSISLPKIPKPFISPPSCFGLAQVVGLGDGLGSNITNRPDLLIRYQFFVSLCETSAETNQAIEQLV